MISSKEELAKEKEVGEEEVPATDKEMKVSLNTSSVMGLDSLKMMN